MRQARSAACSTLMHTIRTIPWAAGMNIVSKEGYVYTAQFHDALWR